MLVVGEVYKLLLRLSINCSGAALSPSGMKDGDNYHKGEQIGPRNRVAKYNEKQFWWERRQTFVTNLK